MKGKMKGFGLYLIILVCLLAGVSYVVSQTQQTETLSYNQIYNYFMDGDVDQYDVDDTTLTMHLKKENQTYTYDLGDYRSVFYNDLGETIQQQMRDGTLTKVDYRTATIPWWAQFLPYVILIVLLIAFWCFMMNKQSGGGAGPMQFGKARAKLAQDDKRKVTFNDVAGADEEKAALAALLHDSAKELPKAEMLQIFADNAIIAKNAAKRPAPVWHGYAASVLCQTQWGVTDPEILSAIECHTTGKQNMSLLDKIIYMADMTSAERDYPGVEALRAEEMQNLDLALCHALEQSIAFVREKGNPLDPDTVAALDDARAACTR